MMDSSNLQSSEIKPRIRRRSFFCTVILSAALTYFLVLALIFLATLAFSGRIIEAVRPYYGPGDGSPGMVRWFSLAGALLYLVSSTGIILFMLQRKAGFYLFFLAALVIFALDLGFLSFDWLRYLTHSGFIFILGIAHFSGRCYIMKTKSDRPSDG